MKFKNRLPFFEVAVIGLGGLFFFGGHDVCSVVFRLTHLLLLRLEH